MAFDIRVGQEGRWELLSPFNNILKTDIKYKCTAIAKIKSYLSEGIDVYSDIYRKYNIPYDVYQEDLSADSSIILLQNDLGDLLKIPENYFKDVPIVEGVLYAVKVLGFSLGPLPKDIDLTYASQKCKEVLLDTLGVQATPKVIVVSSPKIISYQEDIIATAAREVLKNSSNTERSKILEYENTILNLQAKITEYENYIKEKYIPPAP